MMNVIKIIPSGFCSGVVNAWTKVLSTIKKYPNKKIYMLGMFVHNSEMIKYFKSHNLILLNDQYISRYDLINQLPISTNNDIIILSAHGTEQSAIELAIKKKYIIVDTTCKYVDLIHKKIIHSLKMNHIVFYIGKKNHPESNAIISIDKNIIFIDIFNINYDVINQFSNSSHIIDIYNQTTLSQYQLNDLHLYLKSKFKNINVYNEICNATTERQNALINFNDKVDIIFVIGEKKSSNSNELYNIAKSKCKSYLINHVCDIDLLWLTNPKKVAVIAGASTPSWITNNIIKYLESL